MEDTLTITEIVAWWGAVIASLVLVWDVYKWARQGPKLRINVRPNMQTYGISEYEEGTYVVVDAVNVGSLPTTISIIGLTYYKNTFYRLIRKAEAHFVSPSPVLTQPLPFLLEPGRQWTGGLIQNEELEKMAKEGVLLCLVYDAWHKKPYKKRINIEYQPPEKELERNE
jgi:hypothetical protein